MMSSKNESVLNGVLRIGLSVPYFHETEVVFTNWSLGNLKSLRRILRQNLSSTKRTNFVSHSLIFFPVKKDKQGEKGKQVLCSSVLFLNDSH